MSGAIIALLSADDDFRQACNDRIAGRSQDDVTTLYVTVRTLTDTAIDGRASAWRMVTTIIAWVPPANPGADEDPFLSVWRQAAKAVRVLGPLQGKQQTYSDGSATAFYKLHILQGPTETVDDSRGQDAVMYGCSVQLELSVHTEH
jgi:hypothetical protein